MSEWHKWLVTALAVTVMANLSPFLGQVAFGLLLLAYLDERYG